jgi:hypothetical protein
MEILPCPDPGIYRIVATGTVVTSGEVPSFFRLSLSRTDDPNVGRMPHGCIRNLDLVRVIDHHQLASSVYVQYVPVP